MSILGFGTPAPSLYSLSGHTHMTGVRNLTMALVHPPLSLAKKIFEAHPEIEAVYLFGSVATGRAHPGSNLDLGIHFFSPESALPKLDLFGELASAGFDRVDLVYLHEADPTLQYEIVRHNHLLFAAESFNRGEYYSNVLRRFFDLLPILEIQRHAMKERLAHGAS